MPKKTAKRTPNELDKSFIDITSPNRFSQLQNDPDDLSISCSNETNTNLNETVDNITKNLQVGHRKSKSKFESSKTSNIKKNRARGQKKPVTVILGDSMVRDMKGWELSNKNHHVVVKTFRGVNTSKMKWHVKPTIEENPENVILVCGTNNLTESSDPNTVANEIFELGMTIVNESNSNLVISSIIHRKNEFRSKIKEINGLLKDKCNQRNIGFLSHDNINPINHSNRGGLHLNKTGNSLLFENFINIIDSLDSNN